MQKSSIIALQKKNLWINIRQDMRNFETSVNSIVKINIRDEHDLLLVASGNGHVMHIDIQQAIPHIYNLKTKAALTR